MSAKRDTPLEIVTRDRAVEAHPPVPVDEGGEKTLRTYLDVVADSRWLIAGTVLVAAALAALYVVLATPQYKSDVLIQVEDRKAGNNFLAELSGMLAESSPAETEIEIIRSRGMMAAVVRELRLDVVASVKRFPLVGAAVARRHRSAELAGAFLGASYGWGGERVSVETLEVPPELVGRRLTLVAGDTGRFTLRDPGGRELLSGVVGTPASGGGAELSITALRAHPGTEISLVRRHFDDVVSELQREIRVAEKGRKTGVLELSLAGSSAAQTAAILDALSRAYVRQNVERRSAEAEKTLAFLRTQLPTLRHDVDSAEAELEAYRARRGTVDVSLEAQSAIHRAADIEKALAELRVEAAGLRERFTEEHPSYVAVLQKVRRLETERAGLEARFRKLPESELQSARRLRDVKVANELYLAVLNKAQELRVVKEGTIGNVRVLDAAVVPLRPVSPKAVQSLTVGVVLGLLGGILAAFARWSFADGVEDPDEVERGTGLPVSASVPHSAAQFEAERIAGGDRKLVPLLAVGDPKDLAVESLRSLRTSLQFALHEAQNHIVVICGPAPGVGKSFVAANLAHLLGEAGKRVLVVDADLRRGQLHHHFGLADRGAGLSDAITGEVAVFDAVRPTRSPNVSVLTTGHIPSNPAELVGSERFHRVLTEAATRYDVVLVDSPPVLAVTDAALIARHAGVSLLVLRAGKHPLREIGASLRQLGQNGVRVHGIVVNDVRLERGLGRRSAYHYQYKYE
jgi:tyrosine-protein kinase Etk/Wzc